jgi:Flp pilus assembly protein TadD
VADELTGLCARFTEELVRGQLDLARRTAEKAVIMFPDDAAALGLRHRIAVAQEDWRGAETYALRASAAEPANAAHQVNLGVALKQQGKRAAGRAAFARAVELDPRNAEARRQLASAMSLTVNPTLVIFAVLLIGAAFVEARVDPGKVVVGVLIALVAFFAWHSFHVRRGGR